MQTLRAFEAAGRLQSYSRAAEELGLTHGAISHRIRALEQQMGTTLFARAGNRMIPTQRGQMLLGQTQHALGMLAQAFGDASGASSNVLRISMLPALATAWLASRMADFGQLHPTIALELEFSDAFADFGAGAIDAGIRFGPGGWPGLQSELLARETLFPVCTPDYRDRIAIAAPADLSRATLLRNPWQHWRVWLDRAALDMDEPDKGPSYSDASVVLQAAAAGEGVALARGILAHDYLASGKLVRLFDLEVPDPYAYFLVWQPQRRDLSRTLAPFKDWLIDQFARAKA